MNSLFRYTLGLYLLGWMAAIGCALPKVNSDAQPVDHTDFSDLLQWHVGPDGCVNYASLKNDSVRLNRYIAKLENHHPNPRWTINEQKAYWINAYNAFTLRLIVRNYPLSSIKELGGGIYRVNTPWDIEFIRIEGALYDLNDLEHRILRKEFNDPRIHFAINCASVSCPILLNEAYIAERLDAQLDSAAVRFINDPKRNKISASNAELSRIFLWFKGDFTSSATLESFISKYSTLPVTDETRIEYLDYNWALNVCP